MKVLHAPFVRLRREAAREEGTGVSFGLLDEPGASEGEDAGGRRSEESETEGRRFVWRLGAAISP